MACIRRALLMVLSGCLSSGLIVAQPTRSDVGPEQEQAGSIANWAAPPFWSPPQGLRAAQLAVQSGKTVEGARPQAETSLSAPLPFVAITPCRQYDSRSTTPLLNGTPRTVTISGAPCGIPATAAGVGPTNTGGQYDPASDSWTATTTAGAPAARFLHTAVWTGAKMIVWGGDDASNHLSSGGQYGTLSLYLKN